MKLGMNNPSGQGEHWATFTNVAGITRLREHQYRNQQRTRLHDDEEGKAAIAWSMRGIGGWSVKKFHKKKYFFFNERKKFTLFFLQLDDPQE